MSENFSKLVDSEKAEAIAKAEALRKAKEWEEAEAKAKA